MTRVCVCVCVSNLTTFILQYLRQYVSYYIQTWHNGTLMDALYAHARFDDLNHDAVTQWVSKGKNQCCVLSAPKQAISIKLASTGGLFFFKVTLTLTLQTFIWLVQLVFFLICSFLEEGFLCIVRCLLVCVCRSVCVRVCVCV